MTGVRRIRKQDIPSCAQMFAAAFREAPWNEEQDPEKLEAYLEEFISSETRPCFLLEMDGQPVGAALTILIPSLYGTYVRIEDFCIAPEQQGKGLGSAFLEQIAVEVKRLGATDLLLGTQRDYPSHRFYLKNNFIEISNAVLLAREL